MIKYKAIFLVLFCLVVKNLASQSYYVSEQGDSIYCKILENDPDGLRVKKVKKEWIAAENIQAYSLSSDREIYKRKKYNNGKKDEYILLPSGKTGNYKFTGGDVSVLTDGTTAFYQVFRQEGNPVDMGVDIELDIYIENKEGFSRLDYGRSNKEKREEIIKTLRQYLGSNEAVMAKLNDEENADLRRKGIVKLMEEYFKQKLPK